MKLLMDRQRRERQDVRRSALALRRVAVLLHRYVGLAIALFLTFAGLTGSILAFQEELDQALNPELFFIPTPSGRKTRFAAHPLQASIDSVEPLDPFVVARRTQPLHEGGIGWEAPLKLKAGKTLQLWRATDHATYVQRFVDPHTGQLVGEREWGDIREGEAQPHSLCLSASLLLGVRGSRYGVARDHCPTLDSGLLRSALSHDPCGWPPWSKAYWPWPMATALGPSLVGSRSQLVRLGFYVA